MSDEQPQAFSAFAAQAWADGEREIGARVRTIREEHGWTSAAVQARFDEARLAVRLEDVEAGVTPVSASTLQVLCFLLEVKAHDFFPRRVWEPAPEVVDARASVADPLVQAQQWAQAHPHPQAAGRSRIRVFEMANGGWGVEVDTTGTPMADQQLDAFEHEPSEAEWMVAWAEPGCFTARTWPGGLGDALAVFCRWAGVNS